MESKAHTILLIEDDADDAEMTMHVLGKFPQISFYHIDDAEQALQFLFDPSSRLPSMILLDIRMPKVDGTEILARLQLHPVLRKIPVVAFVSSADGRRYIESCGVNAAGYLMKPVNTTAFLTLFAEVGLSGIEYVEPTFRKSDSCL
jgi:two-component system response regulator